MRSELAGISFNISFFALRVFAACTATLALSSIGNAMPIVERQPSGRAPSDFLYVPPPDASAAEVPAGYKVEVAVKDLEYPTSVEFDDSGNMYIAEAGYFYGDNVGRPRILKVSESGEINVVADQLNGPINDLLWHNGQLFISHRGKISILEDTMRVRDIVCGLPALGDHHNNQMTAGPDGMIYFGMGSATNAGVVGLDNLKYLWLHLYPDVHDISPYDLRLHGGEYASANPLFVFTQQDPPWAPHLMVVTSPFHAFGDTGSMASGVCPKANSTILRLDPSKPDPQNLEVYAWGLRNPFGVTWTPEGLFATDNGYDERGERQIANAPDALYCIKPGGWYGFPDYAAGKIVTDPCFRSKRSGPPKLIMRDHPPLEQPLLTQPPHSGVTKIAHCHPRLQLPGNLLISQFGSATPVTGDFAVSANPQVLVVDTATGARQTIFRVREGAEGPPGFEYATAGPRHPVEPYVTRSGDALYISDISAAAIIPSGIGYLPRPIPGTGVVWRITREGSSPAGPPANLSANP